MPLKWYPGAGRMKRCPQPDVTVTAASDKIASPAPLLLASMILATFAASAVKVVHAALCDPHDSIGRNRRPA